MVDQLVLFDESQRNCAHCRAQVFHSKKYCDKRCRDDYNALLRKNPAVAGDSSPTSLYKYYDRDGVLLYVGITRRGSARNTEHNKSKPWWHFVVRQTVEHYTTREEAEACEIKLIRKLTPPFNKQHNPNYAAAKDAYLVGWSLGGWQGLKALATGRNRVAGVVVNTVEDRVTLMVSDNRIEFNNFELIRVASGKRQAKPIDSGTFGDGSGSWVRVKTREADQCTGAIIMYRHISKERLEAKLIELVFGGVA